MQRACFLPVFLLCALAGVIVSMPASHAARGRHQPFAKKVLKFQKIPDQVIQAQSEKRICARPLSIRYAPDEADAADGDAITFLKNLDAYRGILGGARTYELITIYMRSRLTELTVGEFIWGLGLVQPYNLVAHDQWIHDYLDQNKTYRHKEAKQLFAYLWNKGWESEIQELLDKKKEEEKAEEEAYESTSSSDRFWD